MKLFLVLLYLCFGVLIDGYLDYVSGFKEVKFKFRFKVREVVWCYYLINLVEVDFKVIIIEVKGEDVFEVDFLWELLVGVLLDGILIYVFYFDEFLLLVENLNY